LRIVGFAMLIVGALGACGAAVLLVPAWQATHGAGHTGVFTLTEAMSCDRYPPPRQRCGWFGDFVSDDGRIVRHRKELAGGLPPGAKVGDTVRARDAGSLAQIYPENDTSAWKFPAILVAGFVAAFVVGAVLVQPWSWARRSAGA
jgi:hypothetical protein